MLLATSYSNIIFKTHLKTIIFFFILLLLVFIFVITLLIFAKCSGIQAYIRDSLSNYIKCI